LANGSRSLVRKLGELYEHTVSRGWVYERLLPVSVRVIEADDGEAEFSCLGNSSIYVVNLERKVVKSLSVLGEISIEKVGFVFDNRADHLKTTLARKVELDPFAIADMAKASTYVGSAKKVNECLGQVDVVHRDRDMVETFDDVLKTIVHNVDIRHEA
jgi:hypothetical protein